MALDSDAALPFEVHVVKHLSLQVFSSDSAGVFEKTVGQSAFAMVDMGDNAEIAYTFHAANLGKTPDIHKKHSFISSLSDVVWFYWQFYKVKEKMF